MIQATFLYSYLTPKAVRKLRSPVNLSRGLVCSIEISLSTPPRQGKGRTRGEEGPDQFMIRRRARRARRPRIKELVPSSSSHIDCLKGSEVAAATPHACMHTISMWGGRREAPPPLTIAASTLPYLQRNHFCQCRGLVGLCFYSSVLMTILFLFEVKLIKLILR